MKIVHSTVLLSILTASALVSPDAGARPPPGGLPPRTFTLDQCMAADPRNVPSACGDVFGQALKDRQEGRVAGTLRPMYGVDPVGYPGNLASTTAANFVATPSAAIDADADAIKLFSTELSFESLMVRDWAKAKNGSLLNKADYQSWTPHPWDLSGRLWSNDPTRMTSFDDSVHSCQEYVWKLWKPASLVDDDAASCGSDAECMYRRLSGFSDGNSNTVARGRVTGIRRTPERAQTAFDVPAKLVGLRPKNAYFGTAASYLYDQSNGLAGAIESEAGSYCTPQSGPRDYGDGVYVPRAWRQMDPAQLRLNMQKLTQVLALLQGRYSYSVGPVPAEASANNRAYATEFDFDYDMGHATLAADAQVSKNRRVAIRQRAEHLRDLMAQYEQVTSITCPNVPAAGGTGGGGGGLPGGHGNTRITAPVSSGGGGGNTVPPAVAQQVAAAAAIQEQVIDTLLQELGRGTDGCFNTGGFDCDWFVEDRVRDLFLAFRAEEEKDFRSCIRWTGGNTGSTTVDGLTSRIQGRLDAIKKQLDRAPGIDAAMDPDLHPTPGRTVGSPVSGKSAVGQVIAGSKDYGDPNWFGGGYSYGAYWKVKPDGFSNGKACQLDGELHGELHAHADLLKSVSDAICDVADAAVDSSAASDVGYQAVSQVIQNVPGAGALVGGILDLCVMRYRFRHLADAHLTVKALPGTNSYDGDFFFAGEQLWSDRGTLPQPINASWPADPIHVDGFSQTIIVVVVPVTFQVYGEVKYGASGTFGVASVQDCNKPRLTADANFKPWVTVDAFGSAAIGFAFAQAGIRGRLRLLDASLPLVSHAEISYDPNLGVGCENGCLAANADADLNLSYLSGALSAFAKLDIGIVKCTAEKEIFSWDGYHTRVPILHYKLSPIELPAFDEVTWNAWKTASSN